MRKGILYIFLLSVLAAGCTKKRLNQRVTLWRSDKIPYGTHFAFNHLEYLFPSSTISVNTISPVDKGFDLTPEDSLEDRRVTGFIAITPSFIPSERELESLFTYVTNGNHVFISTFDLGENIADSLRIKTQFSSGYFSQGDSLQIALSDPESMDSSIYVYPGKQLGNSFTGMDSTITNILGYNDNGQANFIRFRFNSGGSMMIHLVPLAYSNFFLLHKNNKIYYDKTISYIPEEVNEVYWDDYYRYHENGKRKGSEGNNLFSKLGVFLRDDILKWVIWLAAVLFAIVYLFESKRKQRIIPPLDPLKNSSLDFVKTIGQLYYQEGNNKDLADKMKTHFADHVRNRFNLAVRIEDDLLIEKLAIKSGYEKEKIKQIIIHFREIDSMNTVSNSELFELHEQLDKFYKHH